MSFQLLVRWTNDTYLTYCYEAPVTVRTLKSRPVKYFMGKRNDANVGLFKTCLESYLVRTESVSKGIWQSTLENKLKPLWGGVQSLSFTAEVRWNHCSVWSKGLNDLRRLIWCCGGGRRKSKQREDLDTQW